MNVFMQTIDGVQEILAICPCCGEIFRLAEGKFIFPQKKPRTCEYLDLVAMENRLADQEDRIAVAEEKFEERLEQQRSRLAEQGRAQAKKRLKKIDPTFSGKNIDPQDVKVIFNPVEYTIFHGLNSGSGVKCIEFVSRTPESKAQELIVKSIDKTVNSGHIDFETLHMKDDGSFEIRKA